MAGLNLDGYTLKDLIDLRGRLNIEIDRRRTAEEAPSKIDDIAREALGAKGFEDGAPWSDFTPTSAVDAFYLGAIVTHEGQEWVNTLPGNVWEPGVAGWEPKADDDPDAPPPPFRKPTTAPGYAEGDRVTFEGRVFTSLMDGNLWSPTEYPSAWEVDDGHDGEALDFEVGKAYRAGERVTFEGEVYTSKIDNNVWSPVDYPDGWEVYVEQEDQPLDPEEPLDPADPAEAPAFEAGETYMSGDRVTFEGKTYISQIDNNVWSPTGYPAGWLEE